MAANRFLMAIIPLILEEYYSRGLFATGSCRSIFGIAFLAKKNPAVSRGALRLGPGPGSPGPGWFSSP